jgi:hypothetical protein
MSVQAFRDQWNPFVPHPGFLKSFSLASAPILVLVLVLVDRSFNALY